MRDIVSPLDGIRSPFGKVSDEAPPVVTDGLLLENGTDFLMLEDGSSFLLQE
jgi:hypothetical protein